MKFQPLNYLMKSATTPRAPDMSPSELVSNRLAQLRSALESGEVDAISTAVHGVQVLKTSSTIEGKHWVALLKMNQEHPEQQDTLKTIMPDALELKTAAMLACQKIHRAAPAGLAQIDVQLESIGEYTTLIQAYQAYQPLTGVLKDANEYVQQQVAFMAQHQALGCICESYASLIEQLSLTLRDRPEQSIGSQASYENS